MRAVIIGTDLLYDKDKNLRVLEINSNIGIHSKALDLLDWEGFKKFLIEKNIKNVHLLYSYFNIVGEYEKGFHVKLEQIVSELNINYIPHFSTTPDISPIIDDTDGDLVLRLTYDSNAMIDKYYTSDKIKFLQLINEKPYSANYYYNSTLNEEFNFDGLNDVYENINSVPNYIEKRRFPHNKMNLFKFDTKEDIDLHKEMISYQSYLQEFYYNSKNVIKNKMSVIRSVDFLYGDNLDVFHFGMYKTTGQIPFDIFTTEYNIDKSMTQKSLDMWLSKPHQWDSFNYFLDQNSFIIDSNDRQIGVSNIYNNSLLKTMEFKWISDIDKDFHIEVNKGNFGEGTDFRLSCDFIVGVIGRYIVGIFFEIELENGIVWEDLISSIILTERNDEIKFKNIKNLELGDCIVLFCNKEKKLKKQKIKNIKPTFKQRQIYSIDSDYSNLFLPVVDEKNELSLIQYSAGGSKPV